MSADMTDLLTRLESGAGSDRELDALIAARFDPTDDPRYASMMNGRDYPDLYTSSLDAALSLVERMLPKCGVNIDIAPDGQETVCVHIQQSEAEWTYHGWPAEFAKTAPRAVLKALLRTLEARDKYKRALDQEPQT